MKTTLSENKMRFKVSQKMRAQLGVSMDYLTFPRVGPHWLKMRFTDLW